MTLFFYLAVFALFMLFTGFRLFAEGMFLDGVTYAAISKNLANGVGSFWEPRLSAIPDAPFHGHPPLALGLEGQAFRIFGDNLLVERFYSLTTFLIVGFLIVLIWNEITGEKKSGWIPLFFWILFPNVSWAAASNLLDNTLCIFTTLSILLVIKSSNLRNPGYLVLAGLSVFAGFLTKGPFALFPWVAPLLWEFTKPAFKPKKALGNTLILVIATLIPFMILIIFSVEARNSLDAYWVSQVVYSLNGIETVSSRFYILGSMLEGLIVPILTAGTIALIFRKSINKSIIRTCQKPAIVLFLIGLCGVLPVMISMKQRSFYILDTLPLFALMIALPVWNLAKDPLVLLNSSQRFSKIFRWAVSVILIISLVLPPVVAQHYGRDREKLEMIHEFSTLIPEGSTIRISQSIFTDWSLHSYFMRHSGISLDTSANPAACFFLASDTELPGDSIPADWTRIRQLNGFVLFKK
jgi:4-amino-4-deoxy-L-arabinose transferase-like glycosyltransferase